MSAGTDKLAVTVTEVVPLNELVTRFKFQRTDGGLLPTFSGGAHTVVEMKDGDITRLNPYSLMSDPMDQRAYTISVRRDDVGRGGSLFMHRQVKPGMKMVISNPVNLFALDLRAKKHLMIAGGMGSIWQGGLLLSIYGLGMTAPFILAAFFAKPFLRWLQRHRSKLRHMEKIMGGMLILFAILIATNTVNYIAQAMLDWMPWFQTIG